ncbi:antifreeze protein [Mangrovicoccus ximenensis]|uniref:antifreeze protein n=1 Tax=Mangrovicoccus ximenensis TaxID=1911570 RepID=UPI000D3BAE4D|nr:antifreeze protein [Mangrovicoccus ximenensis]
MYDMKAAVQAATTWQEFTLSYGRMMISASVVIQQRTMQMALGTMKPEEAARMVMEKPAAFAKSFEMAARAAAGSKGPAVAALAAMRPIEAKTRANSRRLAKR